MLSKEPESKKEVDQVVNIRYRDDYTNTEVTRQLKIPGEVPEEEEEDDPQELLKEAFKADLNVDVTVFDYVQNAVIWSVSSACFGRVCYLLVAHIPSITGKLLIPILSVAGFMLLVVGYLVLIAGEQVGSTMFAYRLCLIAIGILFAIL